MTIPLIYLAKEAVERFIKEGKIIEPLKNLPEEFLKRKAGTFVTIKKNGNLRGCIGTYLPTKENIAKEIIHNAIAAATEDWRFGPVQKEELDSLNYIVYVLSDPELVKDIKELDPKKFGIIVKTTPLGYSDNTDVFFNGYLSPKLGVLLPDLAGIETIEDQISIACQKAKIDPTQEKVLIYKFTVEKYE